MELKHIIEAQQFERNWLEEEFFPLVKQMERRVDLGGSSDLLGKRMISLFYEPSTRTRASFEMAMVIQGGIVAFSTENAKEFTKAVVGETLEDTIRVFCRYRPDVIVLRYYEEGGAKRAAEVSSVPIINAGDGPGQHPTQALLDLYTIYKKLGRIDNISIAMCGDLARGRTVRSLSYLLGKFSDIKIYFVSPEVLRMKEDIKNYLDRHGVIWTEEYHDLWAVAPKIDVIYQTRTQTERPDQAIDQTALVKRYDKTEGFYIVNQEVLDLMKKDAIVMHPLPRVNEITPEVDKDPRAVYLTDQVESGLVTRMALLKMILT